MNYNKKTVKDIDVAGKKVLLRCDFNVPQDKATGVITDETTGRTFQAAPFPPFIQNIIAKGGLMNSLKD